jgi:YegS/Rv2252/BmrU family lipid kinase
MPLERPGFSGKITLAPDFSRGTWFVIVNPAAGRGAVGKRWREIERLLQELGFNYSVHFTERPGHAVRLVDDAVLKGHRQILGIGGDGTNHEIVNGLLRQPHAPATDVAYGLLPIGTGNDWVRTHGISRQPRRRLEQLRELRTVLQDVGHVRYQRDGQTQERYFANVAGLAYDGYLVRQLDGRSGLNRLQYLAMIGKYLFAYRLEPARISFDGHTVEDRFYTINVGIGRYSGGGMQFVPHAVPDDGLLALSYVRRISKLEVLLQTPRLYNGTLLSHPRVGSAQTRRLLVEPVDDRPTLLEADGEFLGEAPAEFTIRENALKLVL